MENLLVKEKWVRIMCDYCAEAVWDKYGGAESIDSLPVTQELRDALEHWQRIFNKYFDSFDLNDLDEFTEIGIELAALVKQELPDWTVMFFSNYDSNLHCFDHEDRKLYEYEIDENGFAIN